MDAADPRLLAELDALLGAEGSSRDPEIRRRYGRDETEDLVFEPDIVLFPADTPQVAAILALASRAGIAVTPRGAGTGLSGGALPVRGGWVLSLERLDRLRRLDTESFTVEAEAGIVLGHLQRKVEAAGLFYPPDPASRESCFLGGTIAENAAGPRSCKYGSTRRWVLGLEAVLADGTVIATGGRNRKDVAGYDLTGLLVGSEGTLAVVTAATLALVPRPKARLLVVISFPSLTTAAEAVGGIFRLGVAPAACELLERRALELVARLEPVPPQLAGCEAVLLVELDGDDPAGLLATASELVAGLRSTVSGEPIVAVDDAEQRRLWRLRERIGPAVKERSAYKEADTVVPRGALAELIGAARRIAADEGLEAVAYGHAGDGNLHVNLLRGDLAEGDWRRRRDAAELRLFKAVAELGGTVSGEHGIGWTQREFVPLVRSRATVETMRAIKKALDPAGILNPGKIFPEP